MPDRPLSKQEYAERARSQPSRWKVGAVQDLEAQRDELERKLNAALAPCHGYACAHRCQECEEVGNATQQQTPEPPKGRTSE